MMEQKPQQMPITKTEINAFVQRLITVLLKTKAIIEDVADTVRYMTKHVPVENGTGLRIIRVKDEMIDMNNDRRSHSQWLEQAGFRHGQYVRVVSMEGILVMLPVPKNQAAKIPSAL